MKTITVSRLMSSSGRDNDEPLIRDAYKVKYEECLTKAKLFLEEDPQFVRVLQQNGIELKDKKT